MGGKAMIAMSGGVDSAVAAYLTVRSGCDCVGAAMLLSDNESDAADAGKVARSLQIPFYVFDFKEIFREEVVEYFLRSYTAGLTPNPCVVCNRRMKFGLLLKKAEELGCDRIVTGHYARIEPKADGTGFLLKKALDSAKDQSYFLYRLPRENLSKIRFPLGVYSKSEVREMARDKGLYVADKRESQDVCFIENGDYVSYMGSHTSLRFEEGDFIDTKGNVLGRHRGIVHYTIGQRKGLGVSFGEPMYVVRVDPLENTVTLGRDSDLMRGTLTATDLNLLSCDRIEAPLRVKAKIRSRHPEQWATIEPLSEDSIKIIFDSPQRAITPGQAVVLYDGDVVVGGGTIAE